MGQKSCAGNLRLDGAQHAIRHIETSPGFDIALSQAVRKKARPEEQLCTITGFKRGVLS